ncbi:MAG: TRAP transporter large permease subunit [Candidatus Eremiobacteraeota bacterium]|nr:TRAP transporter large permease subunit [Candidatus Eremiobacteraeota bacterium]
MVQALEIERRPKRRFEAVDRVVGWITEIPAALLVLVEVGVLFAGVLARYVFNKPLLWSDELAQTLFLWLVMFGAAIALRRSEHMRMTALVSRLSPRWQRWFSTTALVVVAIVLLIMLPNARDYMVTQYAILTPALHMHDAYRVLGMVVGIVLMLLIVLLRLAEESDWKPIVGSLAIAAGVGGAMALAHPFFVAIGTGSLAIFFLGLVGLCVAAGVPIAFCFAIATMTYLTFAAPTTLSVVVGQMDQGMTPLELLAVPMFVLLGLLLEMTGIAGVLVNFLAQLVGRLRGGLSYVLLGAMFLISGISGSKAADQAAVAPVLFPEMKRRGAHPGELVAQLAASAAMSETIPPSLVLIIIASVTGVSISALFTGGIMPAFVAGLALVVVVFFRSRNEAPGQGPAPTARQIGRAFLIAIPGLILPLLVRYFVLDGIATATEVSTIGIIYSIVVGLFVYRRFQLSRVVPILVDTAALSGAILLIIGSATAMAWALTQAGFAQSLATTMGGVPGGKGGFLAISIVAFIVLGSVLEGIPAIVLFGPLLFPIARDMHINEVHYTMVVILAMGVGLFSPPFGVGFYQSVLIGRATSEEAIGRIFPYLASIVVALILVAAFPWLSTGLLH